LAPFSTTTFLFPYDTDQPFLLFTSKSEKWHL